MTSRASVAIAAAAFTILTTSADPGAAPKFSIWSTPANLGPVINSGVIDSGPAISKDGLSLFFHSNREGGFGETDIWVSQRNDAHDPWGSPRNLGPVVNSGTFDNVPALSRDEHWLFFHSSRDGGAGEFDLWAAYRAHTHDDFAWQAPVNLGVAINTPAAEAGAGYFENDGLPLLFFGSSRPGGRGSLDIYVSAWLNGQFGAPAPVLELNTAANDQRPSVRSDGLELFLTSDRGGTYGGLDLWVAERASTSDAWSVPVNLGATINSPAIDQQAYISSDRDTLFFASNRAGGFGGIDLYVTTRVRSHRQPE